MENKNIKSYHPFDEAQQPTAQFWGIHLANISQNTTETEIYDIFSKYGEIQKITPTTPSSKDIIFKSPQKSNSLNEMITDQKNKFKITVLDPKQLTAPVAKLNLMGNTATSSASTNPIASSSPKNDGVGFEVHCKSITMATTEEHVLDFIENNVYSNIKNHVNDLMILPGKSMAIFDLHHERAITELTKIIKETNLKVLKFNGNVFKITRVSGDGSLSETPSPAHINSIKANEINTNKSGNNNPSSADTTKKQTTSNDDRDNEDSNDNVVNGVDYLMAFGFDHGLEKIISSAVNADDDSKSGEEPKFTSTCFKLPESVKGYVKKQAESLEIPQSALCLMLGVLTTKGPIRIQLYKEYKANVNKIGNVNNTANKGNINSINNTNKTGSTRFPFSTPNKKSEKTFKKENVPKTRTIKKSIGEISNKSSNSAAANLFETKKISTLNKTAKPFTFAPKKQTLNTNNNKVSISSTVPNALPSLKAGKSLGSDSNHSKSSNKKSSPLSSAAKAPLISGNINNNMIAQPQKQQAPQVHHQPQQHHHQAPRRAFNFPPTNQANNAQSSLFANSSTGHLLQTRGNISHPSFGLGATNVNNPGVMISPRGGISLIHMHPSNSLLSPTSAIISPRRNNSQFGVPPVVVPTDYMNSPMKNNMGIGMKITTPIANLTPVHIPLIQHGNANQNGGFGSPINYQAITPGSPIHYGGITPIINGFTPTAISPNNNYPFLNWFQNQNTNQNREADNLYYNTSNNPYIQKNLLRTQPQPPPPQQNTQFNMPQMMNNNVNQNQMNHNQVNHQVNQQKSNQSQNFFKYPTANNNMNVMDNNKDSPTGSNGSLQQSIDLINSTRSSHYSNNNNMNNNMNNNIGNDDNDVGVMMDDNDDCDDDMIRMDNPPTLEEINNMRSIPSVISPNGTTPVVMITNLNEDFIDCDKLFVLCGVFGDVQRVKISYHKRDTAFVQLANHRQAKHVVTSLNRMQLYGKMIHVNLSRMTRVKLPKDSPNSAMMFPDAKFLTKDYSNCKKHRYSKKGSGGSGIKYSPLSIGQPSHILHIANLPIQSEAEHLQKYLCGPAPRRVSHIRGNVNPSKIQSIELIGVNNKLGSCQAFAKCMSVDVACQILIDFHGEEFLGREIKISFATRSHMPSDINKTHKTYCYTAKKMGSSISSIPAALAANGGGNPTMDNNNSNMSSLSNQNNPNINNNINNNIHNNNNINNSSNNNINANPINPTLPNNAFNRHRQQRNSYLTSYDNSVGYQTFVVNNKDQNHPPDQDKIFVRQHHHSGGRKYHYKLRINK